MRQMMEELQLVRAEHVGKQRQIMFRRVIGGVAVSLLIVCVLLQVGKLQGEISVDKLLLKF